MVSMEEGESTSMLPRPTVVAMEAGESKPPRPMMVAMETEWSMSPGLRMLQTHNNHQNWGRLLAIRLLRGKFKD